MGRPWRMHLSVNWLEEDHATVGALADRLGYRTSRRSSWSLQRGHGIVRRMQVRSAAAGDTEGIASLRARLWPDGSLEEHRREVLDALAGIAQSTLPLVTFVAEDQGRLIGFVEVGLRSHADGCDPSRPCGFLEGWYVVPEQRRRGVGRALVERAELWAREQGCTELASDTWIDIEESQRAHAALGFEVVDRCVHFRKEIASTSGEGGAQKLNYGADLARIHHDHFGMVAGAAARELIARLSRSGISSGTVVDLAAGSGILSRCMTENGFAVWGVDISEDMLRIARGETPSATFTRGSLWRVHLPARVAAVAAVGEAFSYATDPFASLSALEDRLAAIHQTLVPGGVLLFDVASPGRSGPARARHAFWSHNGTHLGLEEREDEARAKLTRRITLFVPAGGGLYRSVEETHELRLYPPEDVEAILTRTGFSWERLQRYDDFELMPGWHAYAATKQ